MRLVTAGLVGLLFASPLLAQEPVTQEREHVVRTGDTLWDLAGFYFSNPFEWRTIYEANTTVVENPHWIYPTEVLIIPGMVGERAPEPLVVMRPPDRPLRTVFYRPPPQRPGGNRATVLSEPELSTLPVRLGEFNSAPYLMDPDRLQVKAVFMRSVREDVVTRGAPVSAHPQDRVYLSYRGRERPEVGERLALVNIGPRVSGASRGDRIIRPTGVVEVTGLNQDVIQATIETMYGPVYPDQLLVPMSMFPDFRVEAAEPVAGEYDLEGKILDFVDEQPMYGKSALAFVNLGSRDGVREGDIFQAYLPPRAVREREPGEFRARIETLPPEIVAELKVIRVTDRYATVKVEEVRLPRLSGDMPVRRIRKIP